MKKYVGFLLLITLIVHGAASETNIIPFVNIVYNPQRKHIIALCVSGETRTVVTKILATGTFAVKATHRMKKPLERSLPAEKIEPDQQLVPLLKKKIHEFELSESTKHTLSKKI